MTKNEIEIIQVMSELNDEEKIELLKYANYLKYCASVDLLRSHCCVGVDFDEENTRNDISREVVGTKEWAEL